MNLRLSMAQMNPVVGDLRGNVERIGRFIRMSKDLGADMVAFPEMTVSGYPPEDLLLKPGFIRDTLTALKKIQEMTKGITAVVGFVEENNGLYNSAAVLHDGEIAAVYRKMYLPNYGVFDEKRYFKEGKEPLIVVLNGVRIGINICEDIWYPEGPTRAQAESGAEIIVNINASPFHCGKWSIREKMVSERAAENAVVIAYVNIVGGQDELVFDGHSMVFNETGRLIARGRSFEEQLITLDITPPLRESMFDTTKLRRTTDIRSVSEVELKRIIDRPGYPGLPPVEAVSPPTVIEEVYRSLVLGTRDYVEKNGFKDVIIALSGGIDSALVCAVAAEAIGKDRVRACFLPSQYSSVESKEDAKETARNLGIKLLTIPIQRVFECYLRELEELFRERNPDTTEENLQARTRGNIVMALSNKFGWLVLTTGNKSEMSVGYATLYGDMAGGFAVIKDVPKTMVYNLCRHINSIKGREVIPLRVLTKAPSAELRPDQKDQDSLPPYEILDPILKAYIEDNKGFSDIVGMGFNEDIVKKVIRMVDLSEYKRRQAPPGIKITTRALGKDWRMPITNRYGSY